MFRKSSALRRGGVAIAAAILAVFSVVTVASSAASAASSASASQRCPSGGTLHGAVCKVSIGAMSGTACIDNGGRLSHGVCYVTYTATKSVKK
jgi:hypothetical protein